MPSDIGFEFPRDTSGQWDGFIEGGMEHFTGSPFEHLGREVPQNTIDAMITPPAQIKIDLLSVPTASVPGIEELRKALTSCLAGAAEESEKSQAFFENAVRVVAAKNINVLQISDYNTSVCSWAMYQRQALLCYDEGNGAKQEIRHCGGLVWNWEACTLHGL